MMECTWSQRCRHRRALKPPYRFRKSARRNRGSVIAATAVAGPERDRAVNAEREATTRVDELKRVSEFQAEMLQGINSTQAGDLLDRRSEVQIIGIVKWSLYAECVGGGVR